MIHLSTRPAYVGLEGKRQQIVESIKLKRNVPQPNEF